MNGIIIINKDRNCTSHDVVYKVKKIFNEKVGHTGTLDPNATGVLPLLIGKATLISKYLIEHDKIYEAEIQLGIKTDTLDIEGRVIEEKDVIKENLAKENIEKVLKSFIGKRMQIPPIYSAIKVNGKKLYEYARKNIDVEIKPRKIEIYDMRLIENDENSKIIFRVECSKGTYIRTLCSEIAQELNTVGYMKNLKRIQVGRFNIKNSMTLEELEKKKENQKSLEESIISIEKVFENRGEIKLKEEKLKAFLNGVKVLTSNKDDIYRIYNENNQFIGLGIVEQNKLKRDVII